MLKKCLLVLAATLSILQIPSHAFVIKNNSTGIDDFIEDKAELVNRAFKDKIQWVKQVVKTSYMSQKAVEKNVEMFLDQEKEKIVSDVNEYVRNFEDKNKNIAEVQSMFLPTEDPNSRRKSPDLVLSVPATTARYGYVCETHTVLSEGYFLNVHRIPHQMKSDFTPKNAIILQHGLFGTSSDWILNGPEKALAFVLADKGYDVWMPNIRGNSYSREHAWLKDITKEFWNFSWHEYAKSDMPAIIDYIIKVKGNDSKIAYIGHSMGTTTLFTMLSLRPEYNDKLSVGLALAPVVFMSNMKSPMRGFADITSNVAHTAMFFRSHEVLQNSFFGQMYELCANDFMSKLCNNIIFYIYGSDEELCDSTLLPVILSKGSSTSWKTLVHMTQMIKSGKFQQFNYGSVESNQLAYHSDEPPEYNLSKVTLNITLFWAQNDLISNEEDVRWLHEALPNTTTMYLVPFTKFNHIDYIAAIDATRLVNDKVLQVLNDTLG